MWWFLFLALAAAQCPQDLYIKTDILRQPFCDLANPRCCLPTPLYRINRHYEVPILNAFSQAQRQLRATYSFQDLFHGHLIRFTASDIVRAAPHDLLLLIHSAEYPSFASTGANLGYCQRGSTIDARSPSFRNRNFLFNLRTHQGQVLQCSNEMATCYAEQFGVELAEILYLPPYLNTIYATPVMCPT